MFYHKGFTFIEVLIALFLLSIFAVFALSVQMNNEQAIQQMKFRIQAVNALEEARLILRFNPSNQDALLTQWKAGLFKTARGEIDQNGKMTILWYAANNIIWRCHQTMIPNHSCLEQK